MDDFKSEEHYEKQAQAFEMWRAGERDKAIIIFMKWYAPLINKLTWKAYKRCSRRLPLKDFEQAALEGLVKALNTFEPSRENLAFWVKLHVSERVRESLVHESECVHIGYSPKTQSFMRRWRMLEAKMLSKGLSEGEARQAMVAIFGIPERDMISLLGVLKGSVHISPGPDAKENSADFMDLLPDSKQTEAVDVICHADRCAALEKAIDSLNPRTATIVRRSLAGETFKQIAKDLGLGHQNVIGIYGRAKKNMRAWFEVNGFEPSDLI